MARFATFVAVMFGCACLGCGAKSSDTTPARSPGSEDAPKQLSDPDESAANSEGRALSPECSSHTESSAGKFSADAQAEWQAADVRHEVVITVRRGPVLAPRPVCPDRATECPELAQYNERMLQQARASQSCVRNLVSSLGGTASDEVLVFGNAFPATLSWSQIQRVAVHPDVAYIEPRSGNPPPSPPPRD